MSRRHRPLLLTGFPLAALALVNCVPDFGRQELQPAAAGAGADDMLGGGGSLGTAASTGVAEGGAAAGEPVAGRAHGGTSGIVAGAAGNGAGATVCRPTFAPDAVSVGVRTGGWVVAGDFDGDGWPDLAGPSDQGSAVSVLINSGKWTLKDLGARSPFPSSVSYPVGSNVASAAVADLNGDGMADLAVAGYLTDGSEGPVSSSTVSILINTGAGWFAASVPYATDTTPASVAVGDFNGDGQPDLATGNAKTVSVLLNGGDGTFPTKADYGLGRDSGQNYLAVGDFNADGNADLAVADVLDGTVSVLLNSGAGTFPTKADYAVGSVPWSVAVGDFNGDGDVDLATANSGGTVSVLLNNGAGIFPTKADYGVGPPGSQGSGPTYVAVGDFNADGNVDLATANSGHGTVSILLNSGTGTFSTKVDLDAGDESRSLVVADFDGNGEPDLAVTNTSTVSVLLNDGLDCTVDVGSGAGGNGGGAGTPETGGIGDAGPPAELCRPGGNTRLFPNPDGWIDHEDVCNGEVGVQGSWYATVDRDLKCTAVGRHLPSECAQLTAPDPTQFPTSFPNLNGAMHTEGIVEKILPCTQDLVTSGCPDHDYANMWGAIIGFDLNADSPGGTKSAWDASAHAVIGIEFTIDAPASAPGLRVEFPMLLTNEEAASNSPPLPPGSFTTDLWPGNPYWGAQRSGDAGWPASPVVMGTNRILWSDIQFPVAGGITFDPSRILSVFFHVPATVTSASPYAFTISNVTLLRE